MQKLYAPALLLFINIPSLGMHPAEISPSDGPCYIACLPPELQDRIAESLPSYRICENDEEFLERVKRLKAQRTPHSIKYRGGIRFLEDARDKMHVLAYRPSQYPYDSDGYGIEIQFFKKEADPRKNSTFAIALSADCSKLLFAKNINMGGLVSFLYIFHLHEPKRLTAFGGIGSAWLVEGKPASAAFKPQLQELCMQNHEKNILIAAAVSSSRNYFLRVLRHEHECANKGDILHVENDAPRQRGSHSFFLQPGKKVAFCDFNKQETKIMVIFEDNAHQMIDLSEGANKSFFLEKAVAVERNRKTLQRYFHAQRVCKNLSSSLAQQPEAS